MAINVTSRKQGLNLQVVKINGTKIRISAKELRTFRKLGLI